MLYRCSSTPFETILDTGAVVLFSLIASIFNHISRISFIPQFRCIVKLSVQRWMTSRRTTICDTAIGNSHFGR